MKGNTEYTTPKGYTYKYLPENFFTDGNRYIRDNDREYLEALLDEAADNYPHFTSMQVTHKLFEYLKKKYHMEHSGANEVGDWTGIFLNQEVSLVVLPGNLGMTIGVFTHPAHGDDGIENLFAKELRMEQQGARIGLAKLLDPNHGGRVDYDYLDICSIIIFG